MDVLLGYLMKGLEVFYQYPADNPVVTLVVGTLAARGGPVVWHVFWLLNAFRDRLFDDTEAAGASWRLASLVYGLWPWASSNALLRYAPRHWHPVILEGRQPDFKLVAVPKERVAEVRVFLQQGG